MDEITYRATNNETGEVIEMTEAQVWNEIVDMFQHDMPSVAEFGSDEEIERQVRESKIEDHFSNNEFEGINYTINRE